MASYVWRRGPSWFFQLRLPRDLQHLLGATPLRIRLPARSWREASLFARHLVGKADKEFAAMRYAGLARLKITSDKADPAWTDEDIAQIAKSTRKAVLNTLAIEIQALKALNEQYQRLEQQKAGREPDDQLRLAKAQTSVFADTVDTWARFAKVLAEQHADAVSDLHIRSLLSGRHSDELMSAQSDVYHLFQDRLDLEKEVEKVDLARQEADQTNSNALRQITLINETLLNKGPKLSACMDDFITAKKNQLGNGNTEIEYFRRRIDAFIALVDDKEISAYHIADLGEFATRLSFLTKDYATERQKKTRSEAPLSREERAKYLLQVVEGNEKDPNYRRAASISYKTIKVNYVGKIKTVIRWLCAKEKVPYPFVYDKIFVPKEVPESKIRFALDTGALHKVFAKATSRCEHKRPEDVWLPLVGYLTGARLGELVYLQPLDIRQYGGVWIFELTTQTSDQNGAMNRKIKNSESRRIVAVHNELVRLGFVDWAREQGTRGHEYVFPRLHENIKRPAHAASKRFQRLFGALRDDDSTKSENDTSRFGKHVFHSLRHSFKDWLRSYEIAERTIALQAGHSLDGIALQYGSKILRTDELKRIVNLPLIEDLKLDAYEGVAARLRPQIKRNSPAKPRRKRASKRKGIADVALRGAKTDQRQLVGRRLDSDNNNEASEVVDVAGSETVAPSVSLSPAMVGQNSVTVNAVLDIKGIRRKLNMTQAQFSFVFGIPCGTIRDWEQGRCVPNRTARTLLLAIAQDPEGMSVEFRSRRADRVGALRKPSPDL